MTEPERAALDHIRQVVDSVLGVPNIPDTLPPDSNASTPDTLPPDTKASITDTRFRQIVAHPLLIPFRRI
jgi:hypothetical protein